MMRILRRTIGVSPSNTGYKTYNIVWHDCGKASATDQALPAAAVSAPLQNARTEPITRRDVATCRGAEQEAFATGGI
ncbi:hypothetical protein CBM2606_A90556 [Cupriavidus taiwanensis]|nr:hypothetical protein CBM2606_A90556 [Cupriavidus taiwanensis]